VDNGIIFLSVSPGWVDVLEVLALGVTGSGGTQPRPASLLELYGRRQSVSCLASLPVIVKILFDVSPDGDDSTRPCHLQNQVGTMWDGHELGECRQSQESIVRNLEIDNLKLYSLCEEIFMSPEGHRKKYLTDGGHCCMFQEVLKNSLLFGCLAHYHFLFSVDGVIMFFLLLALANS
jgi:hypothetical protein